MNEWLKNMMGKIKELWSKWKPIQKVILFGIIAVVVVAIVLTARVSSKPSTVRLFNSPVTDEFARYAILDRMTRENINADFDDNGYISVPDEMTARRMREILISENLVPSNVDPWAGFYDRSWSTTDADQNVKLKNTIQKQLKQHIEAIADVSMADVTIVLPENRIFAADQKPVTASIILKTTPTSTLTTDKKRIMGIQKLVLTAVEGLTAENIIITDIDSNILNDFEAMAESDAVDVVAKQRKLIQKEETRLRAEVLKMFQQTYGEDRCRDMRITVEMDMSKKSSEATVYSPIEIKKDNPDTPYDDSEYRDTLPISQQTVTKEWQGTGYNPEGPAGVEGQTPPVYSDMSNVIGKSVETGVTQNNVINTKQISEVTAPKIDRISVSVNLDGKWYLARDPKTRNFIIEEDGPRAGYRHWTYEAITPHELSEAERGLKAAVGYNRDRGDNVVVTNIAYDRDAEHNEADDAYFAAIQRKKTILLVLVALAVVLIGFILFRVISRELERRRRQREAELLEAQRRRTEENLWNAKDDEQVVSMSVEESRRLELQENAIAMAKEHPEDVAMLIRTWLMEE
ncbi:MAG: flagellar M-ring protein FliF [Treponema sp.]|nr:flagellar M-ring protein FliF [Treponema sp.]